MRQYGNSSPLQYCLPGKLPGAYGARSISQKTRCCCVAAVLLLCCCCVVAALVDCLGVVWDLFGRLDLHQNSVPPTAKCNHTFGVLEGSLRVTKGKIVFQPGRGWRMEWGVAISAPSDSMQRADVKPRLVMTHAVRRSCV